MVTTESVTVQACNIQDAHIITHVMLATRNPTKQIGTVLKFDSEIPCMCTGECHARMRRQRDFNQRGPGRARLRSNKLGPSCAQILTS